MTLLSGGYPFGSSVANLNDGLMLSSASPPGGPYTLENTDNSATLDNGANPTQFKLVLNGTYDLSKLDVFTSYVWTRTGQKWSVFTSSDGGATWSTNALASVNYTNEAVDTWQSRRVSVFDNTFDNSSAAIASGVNALRFDVYDNDTPPGNAESVFSEVAAYASAQLSWWTANGSTLGGAGTWTTGGSNWSVSDTNIAGGTLTGTMAAVFAGTNGAVVTVSSNVQVNEGVRFTTTGYTLSGGTITMGGSNALDNRLSAAASVGATIDSVLAGTNAVAKAGAGTITLGGSNTLSGALSVEAGELKLDAASGGAANAVASLSVASGATLLVAQSNQVNDAAAVTLSGGTISRGGGVSEVFGNLNLTTGSFLDFGTGATGHLTFGTYQNNATPSALLTLNNFLPGNSFTFSSTSFTTNSVGSYFAFGTGYVGSSITNTGSTFTITAIPEPSTYLAAAGLLAVLLWPAGRRMAAAKRQV